MTYKSRVEYDNYQTDYVVKELLLPVSKLGKCTKSSTKTTNNGEIPSTLLDQLKHRLPDNLKFGWLKPRYTTILTLTQNTNVYESVEHYHRAIVSKDFGRSIKWCEPVGAFSEPYHRVALYGKTPDEFRYNLIYIMRVMQERNGRRASLIRLTPSHYHKLMSLGYGLNVKPDSGNCEGDYFGVPFVIEYDSPFSVVEA